MTHNKRDYEKLHRQYVEEGRSHRGMILAKKQDVHQLGRRVLAILNAFSAEEMVNRVLYL